MRYVNFNPNPFLLNTELQDGVTQSKQNNLRVTLCKPLWYSVSIIIILFSINKTIAQTDSTAEKMLLYQRNFGGWPQPGGDPIKYNLPIVNTLKDKLLSEKNKLDCTIDDEATTREIKGLVGAFQKTQNRTYLEAAERGIEYLLKAQNAKGGWGQFYPDSSSYHKYITFNDHAMIDVMWILQWVAEGKNGFEAVDKNLVPRAKMAIERGIDCILSCQIVKNGELAVWCAQHHHQTLVPVKARAFELASFSGNESVGILKFLMTLQNPSERVKKAIVAGVNWLELHKIAGIDTKVIIDPNQPKGKDRIVVKDSTSTLWARFYDLETEQPIFVGRDSMKRNALAEIENERRMGYAYYGNWPANLIYKEYPKWKNKWSVSK